MAEMTIKRSRVQRLLERKDVLDCIGWKNSRYLAEQVDRIPAEAPKGASVERRAVHIAAVIMQADGLCRYDAPEGARSAHCRKSWPPSEEDCVACMEKWLLAKAKKEVQG